MGQCQSASSASPQASGPTKPDRLTARYSNQTRTGSKQQQQQQGKLLRVVGVKDDAATLVSPTGTESTDVMLDTPQSMVSSEYDVDNDDYVAAADSPSSTLRQHPLHTSSNNHSHNSLLALPNVEIAAPPPSSSSAADADSINSSSSTGSTSRSKQGPKHFFPINSKSRRSHLDDSVALEAEQQQQTTSSKTASSTKQKLDDDDGTAPSDEEGTQLRPSDDDDDEFSFRVLRVVSPTLLPSEPAFTQEPPSALKAAASSSNKSKKYVHTDTRPPVTKKPSPARIGGKKKIQIPNQKDGPLAPVKYRTQLSTRSLVVPAPPPPATTTNASLTVDPNAEAVAAVKPSTVSDFTRLQLQIQVAENASRQQHKVQKMEDRLSDVQGYRTLWKEFQSIQQKTTQQQRSAVALAAEQTVPLSPVLDANNNNNIVELSQEEEQDACKELPCIPNTITTATGEEQHQSLDNGDNASHLSLQDTDSWFFDFQKVEFKKGAKNKKASADSHYPEEVPADAGDNCGSLSLLSESSLQIQKELFRRKRRERKQKRKDLRRRSSQHHQVILTAASGGATTDDDEDNNNDDEPTNIAGQRFVAPDDDMYMVQQQQLRRGSDYGPKPPGTPLRDMEVSFLPRSGAIGSSGGGNHRSGTQHCDNNSVVSDLEDSHSIGDYGVRRRRRPGGAPTSNGSVVTGNSSVCSSGSSIQQRIATVESALFQLQRQKCRDVVPKNKNKNSKVVPPPSSTNERLTITALVPPPTTSTTDDTNNEELQQQDTRSPPTKKSMNSSDGKCSLHMEETPPVNNTSGHKRQLLDDEMLDMLVSTVGTPRVSLSGDDVENPPTPFVLDETADEEDMVGLMNDVIVPQRLEKATTKIATTAAAVSGIQHHESAAGVNDLHRTQQTSSRRQQLTTEQQRPQQYSIVGLAKPPKPKDNPPAAAAAVIPNNNMSGRPAYQPPSALVGTTNNQQQRLRNLQQQQHRMTTNAGGASIRQGTLIHTNRFVRSSTKNDKSCIQKVQPVVEDSSSHRRSRTLDNFNVDGQVMHVESSAPPKEGDMLQVVGIHIESVSPQEQEPSKSGAAATSSMPDTNTDNGAVVLSSYRRDIMDTDNDSPAKPSRGANLRDNYSDDSDDAMRHCHTIGSSCPSEQDDDDYEDPFDSIRDEAETNDESTPSPATMIVAPAKVESRSVAPSGILAASMSPAVTETEDDPSPVDLVASTTTSADDFNPQPSPVVHSAECLTIEESPVVGTVATASNSTSADDKAIGTGRTNTISNGIPVSPIVLAVAESDGDEEEDAFDCILRDESYSDDNFDGKSGDDAEGPDFLTSEENDVCNISPESKSTMVEEPVPPKMGEVRPATDPPGRSAVKSAPKQTQGGLKENRIPSDVCGTNRVDPSGITVDDGNVGRKKSLSQKDLTPVTPKITPFNPAIYTMSTEEFLRMSEEPTSKLDRIALREDEEAYSNPDEDSVATSVDQQPWDENVASNAESAEGSSRSRRSLEQVSTLANDVNSQVQDVLSRYRDFEY